MVSDDHANPQKAPEDDVVAAAGDGATTELDTAKTESDSDSSADPLLGTTLAGRYEILSVIGSGAMGTVYQARHEAIERTVAVKVLHAHLTSEKSIKERFKKEAKAAGTLKHKHLIAVHDFGITPSGQPFLVMDFLEGESLDARIQREGSMPIERFITVFWQITKGLQHAHSKGFIHRDLKPSNVMLMKSDDEDEPEIAIIVDFGIAKALNETGDSIEKLTKSGHCVGSPPYMSPEQCFGKALDARTDIYSLGCMMYECLSGKPPFDADSFIATLMKHIHEEPQPLRLGAGAGSPLSDAIEQIVLKCLRKDPDDRFQNASEIIRLLKDAADASAKLARSAAHGAGSAVNAGASNPTEECQAGAGSDRGPAAAPGRETGSTAGQANSVLVQNATFAEKEPPINLRTTAAEPDMVADSGNSPVTAPARKEQKVIKGEKEGGMQSMEEAYMPAREKVTNDDTAVLDQAEPGEASNRADGSEQKPTQSPVPPIVAPPSRGLLHHLNFRGTDAIAMVVTVAVWWLSFGWFWGPNAGRFALVNGSSDSDVPAMVINLFVHIWNSLALNELIRGFMYVMLALLIGALIENFLRDNK